MLYIFESFVLQAASFVGAGCSVAMLYRPLIIFVSVAVAVKGSSFFANSASVAAQMSHLFISCAILVWPGHWTVFGNIDDVLHWTTCCWIPTRSVTMAGRHRKTGARAPCSPPCGGKLCLWCAVWLFFHGAWTSYQGTSKVRQRCFKYMHMPMPEMLIWIKFWTIRMCGDI